jgi:hypothetical protein
MSSPAPDLLVLRRVPDSRRYLAAAMAGLPPATDGEVWWELVDAAAAPGRRAAGVALTRRGADGTTHIVTLAALSTPDRDPLTTLIRALVAALRRTENCAVSIRGGRADVDAVLRAEDFLPTGDGMFTLHL